MGIAQKVGDGLRLLLALLTLSLSASATNYYVVVAGLGGTPEYETQFEKWSSDLGRELRTNGAAANVTVLSGPAATKRALEQTFADLSGRVGREDAFALLLIGHGTFDGSDYKFNIPGPDLTAAELASLLGRIEASRQVVLNMTSCSGASSMALSRRGRIVIAATKSGSEKNATLFPRFFVDALQDPAADTDKNGTVSLLEAYRYTQRKLAGYYDSEKLLPSEHAIFNGARDEKVDSRDVQLASAFPLIRPSLDAAVTANPERQALLNRKQELEAKIDRLKYQKAAMDEEEYKHQLTTLLLDLARTQAEIDR